MSRLLTENVTKLHCGNFTFIWMSQHNYLQQHFGYQIMLQLHIMAS